MIRTRLLTVLREDRGSAIVPAVAVLTLLVILSMSLARTADQQSRESRQERERESSFQLAEGALNAQIYRLSKRWPSATTPPHPASCTPGTAGDDCPTPTSLSGIYSNVDQQGILWTTYVRDNDNPNKNYYSSNLLATGVARDANDDEKLWVVSEAVVQGKTRRLLALVKAEKIPSKFVPNETLVAGWFTTGNNGAQKDIINNGPTGKTIVRCGPDTGTVEGPIAGCADYRSDRHGSQVSPARVISDADYQPGINAEALDQLREQADSQGNYNTGCPPSLAGDQPGEIVFIEDATGCSFQANRVYNSATAPGAIVIAKGGPLRLMGNLTYYGVIYHANTEDVTGLVFRMNGTAQVIGGVVIDGHAGAEIGSDGRGNLTHNANAGGALETFGTAGIVQNSFRELNASGQ